MNFKKAHEAAFRLNENDRFHSLLVCDGVRFENMPGWETVLTFFVIRRANGTCSIVNIIKTFDGDRCESRKVQIRDVPEADVGKEVAAIKGTFTAAVESGTGKKLNWNVLDLSSVTDMKEQVRLIQEWDRVDVSTELPPVN